MLRQLIALGRTMAVFADSPLHAGRKTAHSVSQARTTYHCTGVVTLCAFRGFSSVRRS